MKWKIGNVEIPNQVVLAPMAGVTNESFMRICKDLGAGLVVCEMLSDKALSFGNQKTIKMANINGLDHPLSMQIFGSDIESLVFAAKWIENNTNADIIDINMGCPVNKVAKKAGAGASLLRDPQNVYNITAAVVNAVSLPVTVKIRIGWDSESINAVENAKMIERAGAKAITVHGRTRAQMYSGKADWSVIKEVVEAVNIPVIGNGDITTPELAKKMLDETGCSAVMIGRGALGNPWLIKDSVDYIDHNIKNERPTKKEIYDMIRLQHKYLLDLKGEHLAMLEMRSHVGWYLKGMPGAAPIKNACNMEKDFNNVLNILKKFLID